MLRLQDVYIPLYIGGYSRFGQSQKPTDTKKTENLFSPSATYITRRLKSHLVLYHAIHPLHRKDYVFANVGRAALIFEQT